LIILAREASGNKAIAGLQLPCERLPEMPANFFVYDTHTQLAQALDQMSVTLAKSASMVNK
jgi:hypothetical protein